MKIIQKPYLKTAFSIVIFFFLPITYSSAQFRLTNSNLIMEINNHLQTKINSAEPGSPLMNKFCDGEYLETKYFIAKDFINRKNEKSVINDQAGKGILWQFYGIDSSHSIGKILGIRLYDQFPNAAYITVSYINRSQKILRIKKWVNGAYSIIPSTDSNKFWSFQGSSHSDRRDWIRPVNPGFQEQNYMGMNASDYGGGIPVIDLWRRDNGIAIGLSEPEAKLISLPIDYDTYAKTANIQIEYSYPEMLLLKPGDTLHCFETFVSVHQKDCFTTLQNYGAYMQTKGIKAAASEPSAFEPIWCAWGYERKFTLDQIYKTIPKVKALGIKWVGLDDGYQKANGDWHTNTEHFPDGDAQIKSFVDSLHALGLKAVIWWAPLAMDINSDIFRKNPDIALVQQNGSPQFITYWNAYYMSPTDSKVFDEIKKTVNLFLHDWGFDAIKLDGQHMNACAPDYAEGHGISSPEESFEKMPMVFRTIYESARTIKPTAVIEFCPCGDCINLYHMPYTNQFVASDPESSWQVRLKGKVYKALMPNTAYFGDHVELTDGKTDFPTQIGIGAVPGTKFIWPATGVRSVDENLLTPEKEILFKKYISVYLDKMLSKGVYHGELYDIGYDYPETHCIEKDQSLFYAFYNSHYSGIIQLRGLEKNKSYSVFDYINNRSLGTLQGNSPYLNVSFEKSLLVEVKSLP